MALSCPEVLPSRIRITRTITAARERGANDSCLTNVSRNFSTQKLPTSTKCRRNWRERERAEKDSLVHTMHVYYAVLDGVSGGTVIESAVLAI